MKKIVCFILVVVFCSCAEKLLEKPDNLIPKDKMIAILNDLAIVNAAKVANVQMLRKHEIEPMQYIYKKYNIDSLQFVESDRYYASIPEEYEEIYTAIETSLDTENKRLTAAKKVRDSIKNEEKKVERKLKKASDSLRRIVDKKKR